MQNEEILTTFLKLFVPQFKKGVTIERAPEAIPATPKKGEKQTFMDVHVKASDGKHYIVEMQSERHKMFDERSLFYWAATYAGQLDKNFDQRTWFYGLKPVIAIQVVDYDSNEARGLKMPQNIDDKLVLRAKNAPLPDDQYIKHYEVRCKYSGQTIDHFQMIQIELPRADKIRNLFPHGNTKKVDLRPFQKFTKQDWFLSILRHAQDYTPELLQHLRRPLQKHTYVKKMLQTLEHKKWDMEHRKSYADTGDLLDMYEGTLAIAEARGEAKAEARERQKKLKEVAALIKKKLLTPNQAQKAFSFRKEEMKRLRQLVKGKGKAAAKPAQKPAQQKRQPQRRAKITSQDNSASTAY